MHGLLVFLIVAVPLLVLLVLLVHRMWRSGRLGKSVTAIALVALAWPVDQALFPPTSFYVSAVKNFANLSVPADAVFLNKESSLPDFTGDYSACFVVRLSPAAMAAFTRELGSSIGPGSLGDCGLRRQVKLRGAKVLEYGRAPWSASDTGMIQINVVPGENLVSVWWSET